MKSQTALVARSCRLNEWIQMIRDCKNRPVGMSVDEWCKLNSITTIGIMTNSEMKGIRYLRPYAL